MRLRNQFILLSMLLVAAMIMLIALSASIGTTALWIAEALLAAVIVFIVVFYNKVIKTLNALTGGMDLLNQQDFSSRLRRVGQPDADRITDVFNRMLSQLKNERLRLREQNQFLDLIIKSSPMGVIILDFDNNITSANDAALRYLEYQSESQILGVNLLDLDSPVAERLKSVKQDHSETLRVGGASIYRLSRLSFLDRGARHPFILIESLTHEVMKAEKKAYEKIIRMIAHEVNNSVAGVTATLDTVADALPHDDPFAAEMCQAMSVCSERCYSLSRFITSMADVVKIPEPQPTPALLNDCVIRARAFMESVCSERDITLLLNLDETPAEVIIDTLLIEQVLLNIIKNSAESISTGGQITITTTACPQKTITITDNGAGISPEIADKLFTPFFSTKIDGQGLGLMFTREILHNHNCTFSLTTSSSDHLTRFKITFP